MSKEEDSTLLEEVQSARTNSPLEERFSWLLCLSAKFLFVLSWIGLLVIVLRSPNSFSCLLGPEGKHLLCYTGAFKPLKKETGIYDDAPRAIDHVVFARAGFHDRTHSNRTIYEGRPNAQNNDAWEKLISGK